MSYTRIDYHELRCFLFDSAKYTQYKLDFVYLKPGNFIYVKGGNVLPIPHVGLLVAILTRGDAAYLAYTIPDKIEDAAENNVWYKEIMVSSKVKPYLYITTAEDFIGRLYVYQQVPGRKVIIRRG